MKLSYRYFGDVAILIRYEKLKVEGETIVIECDAPTGTRVSLYSEKKKQTFGYSLVDGSAEIPAEHIEGGVRVHFEGKDGALTYGTPIEEVLVGGERYLVGGVFETREEIKRVQDALVYVGDLANKAFKLAQETLTLDGRVKNLERRANSGDIINF